MKDEKVLEVPEKVNTNDLFNYSEAVKSLVNQKKQEYTDLMNKIALAQTKLSSIEKQCQINQADHNQRMALEKQKFEQIRVSKINEFANREEKLIQNEHRQTEREMKIKEAEQKEVKLQEERTKIYNERIEFEKLKNQATIELSKTFALQTEVQHKINNASLKEQEADKKLKEAQAINSVASNSLSLSNQKEKDVLVQIDNLQKLRKDLQPQFEGLKKIENSNNDKLKEINQKLQDIENKVKQDKELIANIDARNNALKSKELEIATREEEVLRREMKANKK